MAVKFFKQVDDYPIAATLKADDKISNGKRTYKVVQVRRRGGILLAASNGYMFETSLKNITNSGYKKK